MATGKPSKTPFSIERAMNSLAATYPEVVAANWDRLTFNMQAIPGRNGDARPWLDKHVDRHERIERTVVFWRGRDAQGSPLEACLRCRPGRSPKVDWIVGRLAIGHTHLNGGRPVGPDEDYIVYSRAEERKRYRRRGGEAA